MGEKISILIILCIVSVQIILAQKQTSPIRINQVGYELNGPKKALFQWEDDSPDPETFEIKNTQGTTVYEGDVVYEGNVPGWYLWDWEEVYCWLIDFSDFNTEGEFTVVVDGEESFEFKIAENLLFTETISDLYSCFDRMRYEGSEDRSLPLYGSNEWIDLYGGYREASGDDSKHITHLSYANFMNTQEIPGLTWAILRAYELNTKVYDSLNLTSDVFDEAAWGVDYLIRAQSDEGYFYITVWNGWGTMERTVCAYEGYSLDDVHPTDDYESAMREGGGISIAALAKASYMDVSGEYDSDDYLSAAVKAYDHISANNTRYCDDGEENIIDDYTGLVAAIELYKATQDEKYKNDAAERADNLIGRQDSEGFFYCDDGKQRPYFHAADEGYPLIALIYYMEIDDSMNDKILEVIRKNIDWYFKITNDVNNPFNYIRQYNKPGRQGKLRQARTAFFIPQDNETGYWWQGENARLGSMATALLMAARALNPSYKIGTDSLSDLAFSQLNWILGRNPYEVCMLYESGTVNNDPYVDGQNFVGGICNGITSSDGDGGIGWAPYGDWNDWRWLEQWLPHETWYMFAVSTLSYIVSTDPVNIQNKSKKGNQKPVSQSSGYNIVNGRITVNIDDNRYRNAFLNIIDLKGRIIKSININNTTKTIDLKRTGIPTGLYLFELKAGKTYLLREKNYVLK